MRGVLISWTIKCFPRPDRYRRGSEIFHILGWRSRGRNWGVSILAIISLNAVLSCGPPKRNLHQVPQKIDHDAILEMVRDGHHKATLVNVWASWCEPCRKEMPGLVRLRHKYADQNVDVILVSTDDSATAATLVPRILDSIGVDFQTYVDCDSTDEEFITGLNPEWSGALPASFLYDRDGKLVDMMVGGKSYDTFEETVSKLVKGE